MHAACKRALFMLLPIAIAFTALIGTKPAQAHHYNNLLAPRSVCPDQKKSGISTARMERSMRCMHAYARRRRHSGGLRRKARLQRSSAAKARDILDCQQFSHSACGRDAFYWMRRYDYIDGNCYRVAENISMGSGYKGDVRYTMSGWLHSDDHRGSLLSSRFDHAGIGVVRGRYRGTRVRVWVVHFGDRC